MDLKKLYPNASKDFLEANANVSRETIKPAAKVPRSPSPHEEAFAVVWGIINGPAYVREFPPIPERKYRLDFAWPEQRVGVEINDIGSHFRYLGFLRDQEKLFLCAYHGWTVFPVLPGRIDEWAPMVKDFLLHSGERTTA